MCGLIYREELEMEQDLQTTEKTQNTPLQSGYLWPHFRALNLFTIYRESTNKTQTFSAEKLFFINTNGETPLARKHKPL